ncbi:MAG: hypothetical protein QN178_18095 [Armatimonadota bacterium]|nr:hypothetical protein [Armatimonadota bacterium]
MDTMTTLENVAAAIERVLEGAPPAVRKRMGADAFVAYALDQVGKAARDAPEKAVQRLRALGRAVETAKQAFVDRESEEIEVEVFEEETTAAAEESEKEISPVAAEPALGSSSFTENPQDLHKKLDRLRKELAALRGERKQPAEKLAKADEALWPADLNTPEFREGVRKAEAGPVWGEDPAVVRRPVA